MELGSPALTGEFFKTEPSGKPPDPLSRNFLGFILIIKGFFFKCMFYTWLIYILICVESKIVRGAWLFYETRRGNGRGMSLSKCEGQLISLSVCCDAAEIILMDLVWWPFAAVRPQ